MFFLENHAFMNKIQEYVFVKTPEKITILDYIKYSASFIL